MISSHPESVDFGRRERAWERIIGRKVNGRVSRSTGMDDFLGEASARPDSAPHSAGGTADFVFRSIVHYARRQFAFVSYLPYDYPRRFLFYPLPQSPKCEIYRNINNAVKIIFFYPSFFTFCSICKVDSTTLTL